MNKPCFVTYGAYEKVEFSDFGPFAEIVSPESPGFFNRQKIKKLSRGHLVLDDGYFSSTHEKALFRRDVSYAVECYGRRYGIDFSDKDIIVSGNIGDENIARISELFRMVWTVNNTDNNCFYNIYRVTGELPSSYAAVCADDLNVKAELLFNLTDLSSYGINNISVFHPDLDHADSCIASEIVRLCNLPYEIKDFKSD